MGKIVAMGKGKHHMLRSAGDIPYSVGDAIGGMLGVSVKHVKLAFTPTDKDVTIFSVFPREEPQRQGTMDASALNVSEQEKIESLVSVCFPNRAGFLRY